MELLSILFFLILLFVVFILGRYTGCNREFMNNINDMSGIDDLNKLKIYVINLKHREQRKKNIMDELKKVEIPDNNIKIIEAVNGNELNVKNLVNQGIIEIDKSRYRPLRKGEYGCYFSHLMCWEQILKNNLPYGLVLEDDVIFKDNFRSKLINLLKLMKDIEWDIFFLGRHCNFRYGFNHSCHEGTYIDKNNVLYPKTAGYGTFAYIIKNSCIRKLLKVTYPILMPIDVVILKKNKTGEVKVIGLNNDLVKIRDVEDSDTIGIK